MSDKPIPTLFLVDDEAPARQRIKTLLEDIAPTCPIKLVGEAEHAQAALDAIVAVKPDIVLLDVQMPVINGIEFAQHLLQNTQDRAAPSVIFISAHDNYAVQAFDVHASDYLLKPVRAQRLQEAILRVVKARAKFQASLDNDANNFSARLNIPPAISTAARQYFSVMERGRILLVPVREVLYIKAEQKYLTLHKAQQQYLIEESLTAIEQEMPHHFVRIHRNTLIAREALIGVERGMELDEQTQKMTESWQAILKDCPERLTISRRLWPSIKALVK